MEDIQEKANNDELNKGHEEIAHHQPSKDVEIVWNCRRCGRSFLRKGENQFCPDCKGK